MSRPSLSDLKTWLPNTWESQGDSLKIFARSLKEAGNNFEKEPSNLGDGWVGKGHDGAVSRAESDNEEIQRIVKKCDEAADALTDGGKLISENQDAALKLVHDLESDDFSVSDDWEVKDARSYPPEGSEEYEEVKSEKEAREERAANDQTSLRSQADAAGERDETYGKKVSEALEGLGDIIPPSASLSANQAEIDASAYAKGRATPEQLERLKAASELKDSEVETLSNGGDITISSSRLDYLKEFVNSLDSEGGLAAFKNFGSGNPAAKEALADGMNLLANPSVTTHEYRINPGNSNREPQRGGIELLPASWKDPLTSSPGSLRGNQALPGPGGQFKKGTRLTTLDDLETIADIQSHGSDENNNGSDINRALIARAGEISGVMKEADYANTLTVGQKSIDANTIEDKLAVVLDTAGGDEVAVHDIMMTGRDGGPRPVHDIPGGTYTFPEDMPDYGEKSVMDSGKYDANSTVRNLLGTDWDESEGHDSGIRKMFDGMADQAQAENADHPSGSNILAGESVGEVARIIADDPDAMLDVRGHGENSITQLNPEIAESAANAIGPRLSELAGYDNSHNGYHGVDKFDSPEQMRNLFTVMDTEKGAAETFNTHAVDSITMLQNEYIADSELRPDGRTTGDGLGAAEKAGRISYAMGDGLEAAVTELDADERTERADEYRTDGMKYQAGKSVLTTAIGFAPGGNVINGGIDAISPAIEPKEQDPTGDAGDHVEEALSDRVYGARPGSDEVAINFANGLETDDPIRDDIEEEIGDDAFNGNGDLRPDISEDELSELKDELMSGLGPIHSEYSERFQNSQNDKSW